MDYFEIKDVKDFLLKNLILSKSLTNNDAKRLNLSNTYLEDEEENFLPKQWFCSLAIAQWEDVEIFVQGDNDRPCAKFFDLAERIFDQLHQHVSSAFMYLKNFFPAQEVDDFYLSTITFGKIINFDDRIFTGFSIAFYSEHPKEYQYKVKFKEDGWPIGFEGGPF